MISVGCGNPYETVFFLMLVDYKKNYANWTWDKRYEKAARIEAVAIMANIEFHWLDLPVDKIEVTGGKH
ncbi:MAG TPA: hypothetical protein G4O12_04075 [Dehalococcoidia bacterium]|nr:hypothetical protein [Dehalococcoidia bacterium]